MSNFNLTKSLVNLLFAFYVKKVLFKIDLNNKTYSSNLKEFSIRCNNCNTLNINTSFPLLQTSCCRCRKSF